MNYPPRLCKTCRTRIAVQRTSSETKWIHEDESQEHAIVLLPRDEYTEEEANQKR